MLKSKSAPGNAEWSSACIDVSLKSAHCTGKDLTLRGAGSFIVSIHNPQEEHQLKRLRTTSQ
jgi:hypothetical protein